MKRLLVCVVVAITAITLVSWWYLGRTQASPLVSEVKECLQRLNLSIENKDVNAFRACFADSFADPSGVNKADLELPEDMRFVFSDANIQVNGDDAVVGSVGMMKGRIGLVLVRNKDRWEVAKILDGNGPGAATSPGSGGNAMGEVRAAIERLNRALKNKDKNAIQASFADSFEYEGMSKKSMAVPDGLEFDISGADIRITGDEADVKPVGMIVMRIDVKLKKSNGRWEIVESAFALPQDTEPEPQKSDQADTPDTQVNIPYVEDEALPSVDYNNVDSVNTSQY